MDSLFRETEDERVSEATADAHTEDRQGNLAIPLAHDDAQPVASAEPAYGETPAPLAADRALALTDVIAPRANFGDTILRFAYGLGVSGHALSSPFSRPPKTRVLATVESPLKGDRTAGVALRAGHFLINGAKLPIAKVEFDSSAKLGPVFDRMVHGFGWLRDLSASAPREDCVPVAERITAAWLKSCPQPGKGRAWDVELTGQRLLAWMVNAPLVLAGNDPALKSQLLATIEETARWLDKKVSRASAQGELGRVAGWCAITAAGLLLPEGKPRRLYGEAGLIRALGDLVAEDGGVLSRCPDAQMLALALLTDLIACYDATDIEAPQALSVMRELLVPPLLSLRHGDGALGNWQGNGAISADRVSALIEATGVRARPLADVNNWGFHRLRGSQTVLQFDAAPPPRARHARTGCASTLAFEMSDGPQRLIVNCGGSALAGGQIPAHIREGLRATAAHSTLVLNDANSTAVNLHGKLGKGAELVEVERRVIGEAGTGAFVIEASHDGYAQRFGLTHRRTLALRKDGSELSGQDVLLPVARKGKRGKIGFAIRFHLGRGVEVHLSEDKKGASLLLPNGGLWQFRMRGDPSGNDSATLSCEDSLWVDGAGMPHATEQLVIEGMTSRGGGEFAWLLKKMG